MAIKDLQTAMVEVGKIRLGTSHDTGKTGRRGEPIRKAEALETFRFTSKYRPLIEEAAQIYGGECKSWTPQGSTGPQFEVISTVNQVAVYVPRQVIDPFYEQWGNGVCQRRCDGETEQLRNVPCMCNPNNRGCKPVVRFSVMLSDIPGIGTWRVESHGIYACRELSSLGELLAVTPVRLPGRLVIDQRDRKVLAVEDGEEKIKKKQYPVPVLLIDAVTARELVIGGDALSRAVEAATRAAAIDSGPQRQAIGSAPAPAPARAWPPNEAVAALARRIEEATNMTVMRQIWRDAGQQGVDDKTLIDLWKARAAILAPQEAQQQPTPADTTAEPPETPGEVVEPDGEPEPDIATEYNMVIASAPPDWGTSGVNARIKQYCGVPATKANGWQLQQFRLAMQAGEIR